MKKSHPDHLPGPSQSVSVYDDAETALTRPSTRQASKNGDVKLGSIGNHGHRSHRRRAFRHGSRGSHGSGGSRGSRSSRGSSSNVHSPAHFISINETVDKDLDEFDLLIQSNTIIISTEQKISKVVNQMGKTIYEITIPNGQKIGSLISESEASCIDKMCCPYRPDENDPMSFYILSPNGKELIAIYGLDEEVATEDTVQVTRSKHPIGTIKYGYLGASDTLSKVTAMAGRSRMYMIPISVIDPSGYLLYIFRSYPLDSFDYTELLTADGSAIPVVEIVFKTVVLKTSESNELELPEQTQHLVPEPSIPRTKVFTVNFIIEMTPTEKCLVLGIAVTIFNRWLTEKKPSNDKCTIL